MVQQKPFWAASLIHLVKLARDLTRFREIRKNLCEIMISIWPSIHVDVPWLRWPASHEASSSLEVVERQRHFSRMTHDLQASLTVEEKSHEEILDETSLWKLSSRNLRNGYTKMMGLGIFGDSIFSNYGHFEVSGCSIFGEYNCFFPVLGSISGCSEFHIGAVFL